MSQPSHESCPARPEPVNPYYTQPLFNPVKDLSLSGTLSVVAAGVVTLMTLVTAIAVGPAIEEGDDLGGWLAAYGIATAGYFVAILAGFVATGIWLHRARKNAETISPEWSHTRGAGWAWGGWVVPIVSLWFPFQVVRDVHRASARRAATPSHLGWWWGLWIAVLFLERISSSVEDTAFSGNDGPEASQGLAWILFALTAVCAVLWGITVLRITRLQHGWMRGVPPPL